MRAARCALASAAFNPWFEPSHHAKPDAGAACDRFAANGNSHVKLVSSNNSEEALSTYSHHLYGVAIQCNQLADGMRIASEVTLPEAMAKDGCSRTAVEVVVCRQYPPNSGSNAQCCKIVAANEQPVHIAGLATPRQVERLLRPCEQTRENIFTITKCFPERHW